MSCSEKEGDSALIEPSTEPTTEPSTEPDYTHMSGSLVYEDGTPIRGDTVRVQMCSTVCMNSTINEDGTFLFEYLQPATYALDVVPLVEGDYATPLDFIEVTEEDIQVERTIAIPTFAAKTDLIDGSFEADNGLWVDIDSTTFVPRAGYPNDVYFSSVSIPSNDFPLPLATLPVEGEHVRIWYLGAFDAHMSTPWPFRIEGLNDYIGDTLHFFNGNFDEKGWIDLGTATVDADGLVESPEGLHQLSILVVVKE